MTTRYIPELDGMRAIAAIMVVAFHTRLAGTPGGFLGVDVFFVLSGYLTAGIALSGRYDFAEFMVRRLRRLWPLLLFVCATVAVWRVAAGQFTLGEILPSAVFFGNIPIALHGSQGLLDHTWTLANEMQFYALVAMLALACPRPVFQLVCLALFLASTAVRLRYAYLGEWDLGYCSPLARSSGLFAGALLATISLDGIKPPRHLFHGSAAALVLALVFAGFRTTEALAVWITIVELGTVGLIVCIATGAGDAGSFLRLPLMRRLGNLSYGIYLWHYPVALASRDLLAPTLAFSLTLTVSVFLAILSYRVIEQPIRVPSAVR